jgi:hypothetical protein
MAIAYDATSGAARGWVTSDSFSHTCTGANRLLLVWVFFDRGNGAYNVSSMTYAGASMSQATTFAFGTKYAEVWQLIAPTEGANTLAATYNNVGPTAKVIIRAFSYTGVDQTTPLGAGTSATGATNTATIAVSSATDELVTDMVSVQSYAQNLAAGDGQTSRYESDASANTITAIGFSDEAGAASVTMSWTFANDTWVIAAIPIKPAGGAAAGVPKTTKQTLLGVG